MTPKLVIESAIELLTLDECRDQCSIDPLEFDSDGIGSHPHDDMLMAYQTAARESCEQFLGLSLTPRTYEVALDEFPQDGIELPMGPVTSIISVTVGTDSDALMDPAEYVLDDFSVPNRLVPAVAWPSVTASTNTIRIVYTAGYEVDLSDGQTAPKTCVQAVRLLLADWYKHREDTDMKDVEIPNGVKMLLRPHRIRLGVA